MAEFKTINGQNFTYFGEVNTNGEKGPYGIFKYNDGSLYFGEVSENPKGEGIKQVGSDIIVSKFDEGEPNGLGIHFLEGNQIYLGTKENGKASGFGLCLDGTNAFFFGSFKDDEIEGSGVYYEFGSGNYEFRTYKAGTQSGNSESYNSQLTFNGICSFTDFKLDKINDSPFVYQVSNFREKWEKNIQNQFPALGLMIDGEGKAYIGQWKTYGFKEGLGLTKETNNTYYVSQYFRNARQGKTILIDEDGSMTLSTVNADVPQGFSIRLTSNGILTVGTMQQGTFSGDALVIDTTQGFKVSTVKMNNDQITSEVSSNNFVVAEVEKAPAEMTAQEAEDTLNSLIGLASVKKRLEYFKAYAMKNKKNKINLHMAFLGNPGTGKTEVARLIGKILYKNGILKSDKFVEVSSKDIVSQFIGETPIKTKEAIDKAMGGVLFIDEAYSLAGKSGSDHGIEAVDTLLKEMEDHRGEFCCVLAGYTKEMMELFDMNPGFKSRVQYFIDFPDYSKSELNEILHLMVKKSNYEIDDDAADRIIEVAYLKKNFDNFANAREVRSILEKVKMLQAVRTIGQDDNRTLTLEDVNKYIKEEGITLRDNGNLDDCEKELDELIGLEDVKKKIKLYKSYMYKNKDDTSISLHMAFLGNPGTGKTKVARLMGRILYKNGVLPTDKFIEATRDTLVAKYVGQTAAQTKEVVQRALGGVLFIDEAYSLVSGGSNDFGAEAVTTLLKEMEDHQGEFCCILAGYEREINELLDTNPGFKSRIQYFIDFPDYNKKELGQILELMLKQNGYTIDDDAEKLLVEIINQRRGDPNFANAREVRLALEKVKMMQSARTINEMENRHITIEDVNAYIADEKIVIVQEMPREKMLDIKALVYDNFMYKPAPFEENQIDIEESIIALYNTSSRGNSEGSGFLITKDGYAVTCAHCVRGAEKLRVRRRVKDRHNNNIDVYYEANICASNDALDLAIIKLMNVTSDIAYLPLYPEQSPKVEPLQEVVLLGYPFGVSRFDTMSINIGKVSSYQKGNPDYINLDITAKSGNSGSCVVDKQTGYVIGVLCGSNLSRSNDLVEEVNYCRPASYIWQLIKDGIKADEEEKTA